MNGVVNFRGENDSPTYTVRPLFKTLHNTVKTNEPTNSFVKKNTQLVYNLTQIVYNFTQVV